MPLLEKDTREFLSHLNCGFQIRQIQISVDYRVCGILQQKVYTTCITNIDLLTNGCHSDNMIQLGPLRSQSLYQFVQISDAYFSHLLLQYSRTL